MNFRTAKIQSEEFHKTKVKTFHLFYSLFRLSKTQTSDDPVKETSKLY